MEADETFVGCKMKNMHKDKRVKINQLGDKFKGKTVVQGKGGGNARPLLVLVGIELFAHSSRLSGLLLFQHGTLGNFEQSDHALFEVL